MLTHYAEQLAGKPGLWTSTLLRPDRTEREIAWSNMAISIDGQPHGAAIFPDTTGSRAALRQATEQARTAAADDTDLPSLLARLAAAVEGTRAAAVAIDLTDNDLIVRTGGHAGLAAAYTAAIRAVSEAGGRLPGGRASKCFRSCAVRPGRGVERQLEGDDRPAGAPLDGQLGADRCGALAPGRQPVMARAGCGGVEAVPVVHGHKAT